MELVYLWVENYKNIHNQGFNFSGRYRCHYDPDLNELTIDENIDNDGNKQYIENFFGENISVTAIVGENGSGKTSIIEQLMLLFYTAKKIDAENRDKAWLLTYNRIEKLIDISYFNRENSSFNKISINNKILEKNSVQEESGENYFYNYSYQKPRNFNIYYNASIELVSSFFLNYINDPLKEFDGSIYDLDFKPNELNIFALPSKKNRIIDVKKNENNIILVMYKALALMDKEITKAIETLGNSQINFIPERIKLEIDTKELEKQIQYEYMNELIFTNFCHLGIEELYKYFIMLILSKYSIDYESRNFQEYFFEDKNVQNFLQIRFNNAKESISSSMDSAYIMKKMSTDIYKNINDFIELFQEISVASTIKKSSQKLNADVLEIAKLIDLIKKQTDQNILTKEIRDIAFISKVVPLLPSFIKINLQGKNKRNFHDLSYGEKNIISLIYSIVYFSHFHSDFNDQINIFIDEIEIGLNPNWQKKIINIVIKLLSQMNIKIQILIATHSPFILSDIPKENVIFLKDGKQIDALEKKQTFGANIHTLLADGFFMDKGLMGEFAKSKINDIIQNLNALEYNPDPDEKRKILQIIKSIGEDFLKSKLLDMYYKKFDDVFIKEQRKKELIEQQEHIKKELAKLQ